MRVGCCSFVEKSSIVYSDSRIFLAFSDGDPSLQLGTVFAGGDALFLLEYLAEIMGGGEAALDGDVGNGVLLLSEHIASRLYSDDVKIGDEGYANVLWKHVA